MNPKPLRFALLTTFYPPNHFGGDAVCVQLLARTLAKRGHEVHVIHDVDAWRALAGGDAKAGPDPGSDGVTVHALSSRFPKLACLATQQTGHPLVHGATIRRLLDRISPHVIHYHNVSLVGGPGALAYGSRAAVKLYTAHEHWLVCPTHILWRHGREPCDARECLRCQLTYRRPPQLWRGSKLLEEKARHVDVFLSPSHFSAGKHREFGFPREMEVLPHFIPDGGPAPAEGGEANAPPERPYFLFVGRLERIKGLQDVIPLFDDDAPADLLIAGDGEYEAELRALAEGRPRVRFLGRLGHDRLRGLYARARALLAPSICYEVFPMILLEAFREGTPVIARRLGPYPELIEESGAGRLFGDAAELRQALHDLAGDPALRERLGASGRRALAANWSERAVMARYFGIIGRVARARGLEETRRIADALGSDPGGGGSGVAMEEVSS